MTRPIVRIHDTAADEIIDREMTDAEFAEYNEKLQIIAQEELAAKTKEIERQAILERIGLTSDELKTILG